MWSRVARTVRPLHPPREGQVAQPRETKAVPPPRAMARRLAERSLPAAQPAVPAVAPPVVVRPLDRHGLDAGWDRRLGKGTVSPDFTLDLHGCTLDAAHSRLDHGITQALAHGARVVLVITGRPRPADAAGRGERRGAIRAKFMDWLEAGPHAGRIAAIRAAHPRHGGAGAVYVVLKRAR